MVVTISDYVNVIKRASDLGCKAPTGFSLLPRNFERATSKSELVHEPSVRTVRALWREASINETKLEGPGESFPYVVEEHLEWVGPVIFISASVLSQDPHLVPIALGVISNYLTEWFRGVGGPREAKLTVVVEKTPNRLYRKLDYKGPPGQVGQLKEAVFAVLDDE